MNRLGSERRRAAFKNASVSIIIRNWFYRARSRALAERETSHARIQEILMAEQGFTPPTSEWYHPSSDIVEASRVPDYDAVYELARQDPAAFWAKRAEELEWYQKWDQVLDDSKAPFYKWFVGGKTNMALNALDRHVTTWRRNKLAIIWEGEDGDKVTMSYWRLWQETNKFANVLRGMGVTKGDRVTIYMGRVPEIAIAMLACAKIGAPHSVVYGGFSEQALASRIEDAQSRVLITCDGAWLRGKIVPLKDTVDEAVQRSPVAETVIVVKRTGHDINMEQGRDYWYHELMALPIAGVRAETEVMDAEDPLFILYTSGTTGKPKGVLHTHGGYQVYTSTTLEWAFDIKEEDRWWCAADPGWITGHSYIVYAPLILGATSIIYEGAPTYPYPDRWWQIVAGLWRDHSVYRAHRHSRFDALRRGLARAPRSQQPAPAGHGGRTDQPRSLALVSSRHRTRTLPHHRYLVADRNRRLHDHAPAVGEFEAGQRHPPLPRHSSRYRR